MPHNARHSVGIRSPSSLVVAALLAACSADVAGPAGVVTVQVTPATTQIQVAATTTLTATPRDASGNALTGRAITWASANTAVATVSLDGVVTGAAPGATQINATSEGVSGSATVTVMAGPAAQLVFTAQPGTAAAGAALNPPVRVAARDAQGNLATSFTGPVTIALGANPSGATLSGTTTVTATAGEAVFANLTLDRIGSGFTLSASAPPLPAVSSASFNVTAGPASRLDFTVQPTDVAAGDAIAPAVEVTARDAAGNVATGFAGAVTLAFGTNPTGATLGGTTTATAVAGVATFGNVLVDRTGSGYTLQAAAPGLATATSTTFAVSTGAAAQLSFSTPPSTTTAGAAITPAVTILVRDGQGNPVTTYAGSVTVALSTNPGGGTLSGTTTVSAAAGVATFPGLSIDRAAAGYVLTASAASLQSASSAPFTITAGPASTLAFTAPPTATSAGQPIAPAVEVTARDALGNVATGFTAPVTVSLGANPGGSVLSGTTTVSAVAGVATFGTLSLDKVGTGYTLRATGGTLGPVTSAPFDVTAGAATQLAFTVPPSNVTAGTAIAPAVQVTARDNQGNVATGFTGAVTITIGANPAGGTLSGTPVVNAVAGVATFDNLRIDRTGNGYTLRAAATGLPTPTSSAFNVTPGPAAQLQFTIQPTTTVAGATMGTVQVTALDAGGNLAGGFAGAVTVAIGTNPAGGTLSGTKTVTAAGGIASFTTLSIDKAGAGYTLTAAATGLGGATSGSFTIAPGALTQLTFRVQPTTTAAGAAISPPVQVAAEDAFGNTVTGFNGSITVAISVNPGAGTLSGTTTLGATAGVATFANLSIDKAGQGYVLQATGGGASPGTSAAFDVGTGVATQLAFTVQPSSTAAGAPITPAVQVSARDAFGNAVTSFSGAVTVAIGTNPGGGALSGTTTVVATAGVATFATLSIDKAATGYTLTASATGLTGATSAPFGVTAATATQLAFSVQPSTTVAGSAITPAIQVQARDAGGNLVAGFTGTVTLAIGSNPAGGTLSGTTAVAAVNGVASFPGMSIDKAAAGYALTASASGVTSATSAAFAITAGTATQVGFTVQPSDVTAGAAITPAVQVSAQDAFGNTVAGFSGNVTVAIGTNPGGGTLSGTTTVGTAAGVATFANLSINKSGSGYTLTATASGLTNATSAAFTVNPGTATQLAFTVQPSDDTAGTAIAPAVQVTARDAQGNVATAFAASVTVAIGTNPAGGTLSGTKVVSAAAGVATFSTLSVDRAAPGYTLTATASGLAGATSTSFAVLPGTATRLVFSVQPSSAVAGVTIAPPIRVTAQDALGNTATGFTGDIVVALGANPGGGTLAGTATVAAVTGVATFATLSVDKVGSGYTLTAAATGLSGATSGTFAITPGPTARLAFTVQPTATVVNIAIAPAVQVTARDAQGNTTPAFTGAVAVALGANPGGGTLAGTDTVAAVNGIATFSTLSIDQAAAGYTLVATAASLTPDTSDAFTVSLGATRLAFTVQPATTVAGVVIAPAVKVAAQDPAGNTATSFDGTITVAIGTNPGGGTLSGTKTVAAVAGVATFNSLTIDKAASGYTLTASATGLTGGTSAGFQITPGTPSAAQSSVATATDTLGQCLVSCALGLDAARVTVTVRDQFGNLVPGATVNMTASPPDSVRFTGAGASGVSNGSGVFQTDVNVARAGTQTIAATVGGGAITPGATIAVMPVLVGAGDIARCDLTSDDAVARLLDSIPGVVYTLGDNAYPDGTAADFNDCYHPAWGRHKARTRPNPGNRDYGTAGAAGYYAYFGAVANPSGGTGNQAGYYSFDLGAWHIVSLNTEVNTSTTSPQGTWLRQDLSGRTNQCVLAMWHKPLYGSTAAPSGSSESLWQMAADSGVEVVLNGHAHIYERFAPMDAAGNASATGLQEIIVGTGGTNLGGFATDPPNSLVRDKTTHGVLRLVLYPNRYRWEFIPAPGFGTFTDTGTRDCN